MNFTSRAEGNDLLLILEGRLDSVGAKDLQSELEREYTDRMFCVLLEMSQVEYLSSAGLRILMNAHRNAARRGGTLALVNPTSYSHQVLEIAGFDEAFPVFDTLEAARAHCALLAHEQECLNAWDSLEKVPVAGGVVRILPVQPATRSEGAIEVLGNIMDVLKSEITREQLCSKRFSDAEYSIGLGGLGENLDDYFHLMGEMITIGGTMVWLPTDGNDTPDFLIPRRDKGEITLRTGFNVSLTGGFNELILFESHEERGTTMTGIYRALFDLARVRRPDFKGVLGLALRAQMDSIYGSGVKLSPVIDQKPANGEMITHPSNFDAWFEFDREPRHTGVTALITGIGADLGLDLSTYSENELHSVFYLNPANLGGKLEMLHNHAVIFSPLPEPSKMVNLDREIRKVVEAGDFTDMRHLLDTSAIRSAFIGVNYVQNFRRDPHGRIGSG